MSPKLFHYFWNICKASLKCNVRAGIVSSISSCTTETQTFRNTSWTCDRTQIRAAINHYPPKFPKHCPAYRFAGLALFQTFQYPCALGRGRSSSSSSSLFRIPTFNWNTVMRAETVCRKGRIVFNLRNIASGKRASKRAIALSLVLISHLLLHYSFTAVLARIDRVAFCRSTVADAFFCTYRESIEEHRVAS